MTSGNDHAEANPIIQLLSALARGDAKIPDVAAELRNAVTTA